MTTFRHTLLSLAFCLPLAACNKPSDPAPAADPTGAAPGSFLGRQVDKAIDAAREELRAGNLSLGDGIAVTVNGTRFGSGQGRTNLPKAEITPRGELLVEDRAVAIDEGQRRLLLAYREQVLAIAEAGMDIGSRGAELAGKALGGVAGVVLGGEQAARTFEATMEAEGERIEREAMQLCTLLPELLQRQRRLAAAVPEFAPYARMDQDDVDRCGRRDDATEGTRDAVRSEIHDGIRAAVRAGRGTDEADQPTEAR